MINNVYEYTLGGCSSVDTPRLRDIIISAKKSLRPGIGTRSKILFTHPSNLEKVRAIVKAITDSCTDLFNPFPFRIFTNIHIPSCVKRKTGRILWAQNRFCDYSHKSSVLSDQEHLETALYFGWAKEEEISCVVWYELGDNSLEKTLKQSFEIKNNPDLQKSDAKKRLALSILEQEGVVISDKRKAILYGTI